MIFPFETCRYDKHKQQHTNVQENEDFINGNEKLSIEKNRKYLWNVRVNNLIDEGVQMML